MRPKLSYTIWFSQRTGSSLLCKALEATGIAGKPGEWLYRPNIPPQYTTDPAQFQEYLWEIASTDNGVWGLKHSFYEPAFSELLETLREFPTCEPGTKDRAGLWESAFPNHRHIFMTRRNKVRLAVSWWRAIKSQEWHRQKGEPPKHADLSNDYSFDAIKHLYMECSMREAGIQEFFTEGGIMPLTLVYEDFIQQYEPTIQRILEYLEVNGSPVKIAAPYFDPTADEISEEWCQRFRHELQSTWGNRGW